ncbi:hypothetical protein GCM10020331_047160 [Ectobacillus funiculus]
MKKSGAYSNLLLNSLIEKNKMEGKDTGLLTEIVYGTIQRREALDFFICSRFFEKKPEQWVKILLRLSLYQMLFF